MSEGATLDTSSVTTRGEYNAAVDLVGRNLRAGRGSKVAFFDRNGSYTYDELAARVARFAGGLRSIGVEPEQRVLLCLTDTVDFPTAFLGAMHAGVVPVAVSTMLTARDYEYLLGDSRARAAFVSTACVERFGGALTGASAPRHVVLSGEGAAAGAATIGSVLARGSPDAPACPTVDDDVAFWLYSSGSTGVPKGVVHAHAHLRATADLYARPVLGLDENDVVYSAAKLFFAYGLGNALTFPLAVGASAVLVDERPTPGLVCRVLRERRPTVFGGVPTLYGSLLVCDDLPASGEHALRRCVSAGEPLPEAIGRRWHERTGVDILDGLGSTEMLHVFLSNRPGDVRYGTTGRPVEGYEVRLVDDGGAPVARGEIGELHVRGPTAALCYWNRRDLSRRTFLGEWTRSGDKYRETDEGYFVYCGRVDDMLKVGGIYVAPAEVEEALVAHDAVLEAAVVGRADDAGLVKPAAYVVVKPGVGADEKLAGDLKAFVKDRLAPYKYPRWVEFVDALPKTATGKIQRFKLRRGQGPCGGGPA